MKVRLEGDRASTARGSTEEEGPVPMHVDEEIGGEERSHQIFEMCGEIEGKLAALYWEHGESCEDVTAKTVYTLTETIKKEVKELQVEWTGQLRQKIKSEGALRDKRDKIDRDEEIEQDQCEHVRDGELEKEREYHANKNYELQGKNS